MGDWLKVNAEAIYGTRRWVVSHEGPLVESVNPRLDKQWKWIETRQRPMVYCTTGGDAVYALCLAWPGKKLKLDAPLPTTRTKVEMLGGSQPFAWKPADKGIIVEIPEMSRSELPCRNAWVFKLTGLKNCKGDK